MDPTALVSYARRASGLAVLGAAYVAIRAYQPRATYHHVVARHPRLVAWNSELALCASQLAEGHDDGEVERLVALLDDYRKWDEQRAFHSQGRMSKLIPHIEACARRMCAARPESVDALRASAFARDELLPRVQGALQDVLHNHLQDVAAV